MAIGARTFAIILKQSANGWLVSAFRDPATEPVDVTAASPATVSAHVVVGPIRGQGINGPNADGGHSPSAITGATNATPIVITQTATSASLGIAVGDVVEVTGVLGNLNANGTFEVSAQSGSTVTLKGSAGSAAYTSGGYIRKINPATSWTVAAHAAIVAVANDLVKNG